MANKSKKIKKGTLTYQQTLDAIKAHPYLLASLSKKTQGVDKILSENLTGEDGLLNLYLENNSAKGLALNLTRFSNSVVKDNPELQLALLKEDNNILFSTGALKTKDNAVTILKWENENNGQPGKGRDTTIYASLPRSLRTKKEVILEAVANPVYGTKNFQSLSKRRQTNDVLLSAYNGKDLDQCKEITSSIKGNRRLAKSLSTIAYKNPLYVFNEELKDRVYSSTRLMRRSKFHEIATGAALSLEMAGMNDPNFPYMVKEMVENMPQRKIRLNTAIDMALNMGASIAGDTGTNISEKDKLMCFQAMESFYNTLREGEFNYEGKNRVGKFIEEHKNTKTSKLGAFLVDTNPNFITKIHDDDLTPKIVKSAVMQNPSLLQTVADRSYVNEKTQRAVMRQIGIQIKMQQNVKGNMELLSKIITSEKENNAFNVDNTMAYTRIAKRTMAKIVKENPEYLLTVNINDINPELQEKFLKLYTQAFRRDPIVMFDNCMKDINLNKNTDSFMKVILPILGENRELVDQIRQRYPNLSTTVRSIAKLEELNIFIAEGKDAEKKRNAAYRSFEEVVDPKYVTFNNALHDTIVDMVKTYQPKMTEDELNKLLESKKNIIHKARTTYYNMDNNSSFVIKQVCVDAVKEITGIDIGKESTISPNSLNRDDDFDDEKTKALYVDELSDKELEEGNLTRDNYDKTSQPRDLFQGQFEALAKQFEEAKEADNEYEREVKRCNELIEAREKAEKEKAEIENKLAHYRKQEPLMHATPAPEIQREQGR